MEMKKETLQKLYVDEGRSINNIAKQFGVNWGTINRRLKKWNISRPNKEKFSDEVEV